MAAGALMASRWRSWPSVPPRPDYPLAARRRPSWRRYASSASGSASDPAVATPLSAAIMAEYANRRKRGAFLAAVYAMQGMSILLSNAVALVVSAAMPEADYVWRTILMAGAAPAALAFYLRMKLPETARYTALVAGDLRSAATDMSLVLCATIREQEIDASVRGVDDKWGLFSVQCLLDFGYFIHAQGTNVLQNQISLAWKSKEIAKKKKRIKMGR